MFELIKHVSLWNNSFGNLMTKYRVESMKQLLKDEEILLMTEIHEKIMWKKSLIMPELQTALSK